MLMAWGTKGTAFNLKYFLSKEKFALALHDPSHQTSAFRGPKNANLNRLQYEQGAPRNPNPALQIS